MALFHISRLTAAAVCVWEFDQVVALSYHFSFTLFFCIFVRLCFCFLYFFNSVFCICKQAKSFAKEAAACCSRHLRDWPSGWILISLFFSFLCCIFKQAKSWLGSHICNQSETRLLHSAKPLSAPVTPLVQIDLVYCQIAFQHSEKKFPTYFDNLGSKSTLMPFSQIGAMP